MTVWRNGKSFWDPSKLIPGIPVSHTRCDINKMRIGELLSEACYVLTFLLLFQLLSFLQLFKLLWDLGWNILRQQEYYSSIEVWLSSWSFWWYCLLNRLSKEREAVLPVWFFALLSIIKIIASSAVPKWKAYPFLLWHLSFINKLPTTITTKPYCLTRDKETCYLLGKVSSSKNLTWNELFTGLEERLAKSMLQLRNKPTLSPKQLEADKTLSSKVLERQRFRVLLASSGRRDDTGRMLRGRNEPPRRRMWRELEIEWLRRHGEIEQRQIRHRKRCCGVQGILSDLRNKQNKIDKSKWLSKANGNEIKWTVQKISIKY